MIHVNAMAKFMNDDITGYPFRELTQQYIKGKISFHAAASPTAFHRTDADLSVGYTDFFCIQRTFFRTGSSFIVFRYENVSNINFR